MSLISNVYSFKFFIEPLGCLCSKEEVGRMPRRCAATSGTACSNQNCQIRLFCVLNTLIFWNENFRPEQETRRQPCFLFGHCKRKFRQTNRKLQEDQQNSKHCVALFQYDANNCRSNNSKLHENFKIFYY